MAHEHRFIGHSSGLHFLAISPPILRLRYAYATPKLQNRCFADFADLDFHILFLRLIQVDGLIIDDWLELSVCVCFAAGECHHQGKCPVCREERRDSLPTPDCGLRPCQGLIALRA